MYDDVEVAVTWETSANPRSWANFALKQTRISPRLPRNWTQDVCWNFCLDVLRYNMICCADLRGDCSVQIVSWLGISWRHGPFVQFQRTIFSFYFLHQQLKASRNYSCPFWLTFHIFSPIRADANTLHVEQFFGQIVFIFSRHSNPNRRFHLFSFRESVFSGIFSGSKIIWKGVSFLFLLHLLPVRGAHKS